MDGPAKGGFLSERILIERRLGDDGLMHVGASFQNESGEMLDPIVGFGMLEAAKWNLMDRITRD